MGRNRVPFAKEPHERQRPHEDDYARGLVNQNPIQNRDSGYLQRQK